MSTPGRDSYDKRFKNDVDYQDRNSSMHNIVITKHKRPFSYDHHNKP